VHIYKFTHLESGRCYIGQTVQNPNRRRLEHISGSRYSKKTYHFHNALKKYGIDAFSFEVIAVATTIDELNLLEEQFVEKFDSINNGFNIRKPGNNKTHSVESIERMRSSQRVAHARRKLEGRDTFKKSKKTSGWTHSEESKAQRKKWSKITNAKFIGKTWKVIDGKRVWMEKQ
jgi:group I intron endonuclease